MSQTARLVLLPGMDGSGTLFQPLLAALGPDIATTLVNYPFDQALGYEALEAQALSALPHDQPYFLLGESFSGPIALSLAARRPAGLQGLLLCATFARNPYPALGATRALLPFLPFRHLPLRPLASLLLGRYRTPALSRALDQALAPLSGQAMRARVQAVLTLDLRHQLARIEVPSLYLQAQSDRVVPSSAYRTLQAVLPGLQKQVLAGPHCLLQAQPEAAAQAIRAFIQQHRPTA